MTIKTVKSEEARLNWSETVEHAYLGGVVVIERWNRPVVGLVSHERLKKLLELERIAEYKRQFAEVAAGGGVDFDLLTKEPA